MLYYKILCSSLFHIQLSLALQNRARQQVSLYDPMSFYRVHTLHPAQPQDCRSPGPSSGSLVKLSATLVLASNQDDIYHCPQVLALLHEQGLAHWMLDMEVRVEKCCHLLEGEFGSTMIRVILPFIIISSFLSISVASLSSRIAFT